MSAQHVRSASLGSLAAAAPVFIEIAVTSVWWNRLPDRIATTFGPDGSPDGYGTPLGTVSLLAAVQTLFLVAAVGSAFARDRRKGRIACAVTAGFIAAVAISWLIIAGVAASTVPPEAWWAILAGPAWAVVPYWLLRLDKEAP
ncbi:DUF1648 domain-containing protein [Curtobacterium sp. UNCCL17]|uniref:DUF1648 domain-containing protein n=1 Tax=Curtobacterium sp. UNCCL17 TaxID=1449051 RepID=UPI0009DE1895